MKIEVEFNERDYTFLNMFNAVKKYNSDVTWNDVIETGLLKMLMDVRTDD